MSQSRENFMKSALLVIEDRTGILLSLEKLSDIIGDLMDDEWQEFEYIEVSPFMDTAPREEIMEIVTRHYLGCSWPTYGDIARGVSMEKFGKELITAMSRDQVNS